MLGTLKTGWQTVSVADVDLEIQVMGAGPTLLFLHSGFALELPSDQYLHELACSFRVIAPRHPGFSKSRRPSNIRDVSDLAYLYLELADLLEETSLLVGASFGGWIAAEMVIRSPRTFDGLALISPVGLKAGARDERDIADIFAMTDVDLCKMSYAGPSKGVIDTTTLNDDLLTTLLRGQESLAYYAWDPYMHNPRLERWLSRIRIPTLLVLGDQDRVVSKDYYARFARALPSSTQEIISDAGHFPHHEQPQDIAAAIASFYDQSVSSGRPEEENAA